MLDEARPWCRIANRWLAESFQRADQVLSALRKPWFSIPSTTPGGVCKALMTDPDGTLRGPESQGSHRSRRTGRAASRARERLAGGRLESQRGAVNPVGSGGAATRTSPPVTCRTPPTQRRERLRRGRITSAGGSACSGIAPAISKARPPAAGATAR